MGNPGALTISAAMHNAANTPSNSVTQWNEEGTTPTLAIESDHPKANSLGDHPSTVT